MGNEQQDGSGATGYGSPWTAGDVIGVAVDAAAGKIRWSENGVWQASGDPVTGANAAYTGLTGTLHPAVGSVDVAAFPGRFKSADLGYSVPSGIHAPPIGDA
ncbi:hypothetical protein [Azospirillum melinis]